MTAKSAEALAEGLEPEPGEPRGFWGEPSPRVTTKPRRRKRPARQPDPLREEVLSLKAMERDHIARVMALTGGSVRGTARLLGVQPKSLRAKMARHGLDLASFRSPASGDGS